MGEQTNKLVYILATSHSGSTLTAMLLNSHPSICSAGELKISSLDDPDSYRCSCKDLIRECQFWRDVSQRMAGHDHDFDVLSARTSLLPVGSGYVNRLIRPLHRGPVFELARDSLLALSPEWKRHRIAWQKRTRALVDSIASIAHADYVVDSSKTGVRLKYLRRIPGLEVKVIRLVRDGRAVALTYMDSDNYADAKDPIWRGGGTGPTARPKLNMEAAATRWLNSNMDAEAVLKTIPESDLTVVNYEQLCTDPTRILADIFSFLGLDNSEKFWNFRSANHHIVGNGMRLDDSSEIILDDRWKSVLTSHNLRDFDSVGGALNRHFGYS